MTYVGDAGEQQHAEPELRAELYPGLLPYFLSKISSTGHLYTTGEDT